MIILAFNIKMFIFGIRLWKTIRNNDGIGMMKLIKTGCYIMESLELLACIGGLGGTFWYLVTTRHDRSSELANIILAIPALILMLFCLFFSLMVQGVRDRRPVLVNTNIIFKIFLFIISCPIGGVVLANLSFPNVSPGITGIIDVLLFLLYTFLYFYSNGFILLHYNIMIQQNTQPISSLSSGKF